MFIIIQFVWQFKLSNLLDGTQTLVRNLSADMVKMLQTHKYNVKQIKIIYTTQNSPFTFTLIDSSEYLYQRPCIIRTFDTSCKQFLAHIPLGASSTVTKIYNYKPAEIEYASEYVKTDADVKINRKGELFKDLNNLRDKIDWREDDENESIGVCDPIAFSEALKCLGKKRHKMDLGKIQFKLVFTGETIAINETEKAAAARVLKAAALQNEADIAQLKSSIFEVVVGLKIVFTDGKG